MAAPARTQFTATDPVDSLGPLDLIEVTLGQRDVRMTLRVVSTGTWDSRELTEVAGRELCITIVHGDNAMPRSRICVTRRAGRTGLDLIPLAPDGTAGPPRVLAADPARPAPDVLEITFLPAAADLSIGPFAWYADSAWTDDAHLRGDLPRSCTRQRRGRRRCRAARRRALLTAPPRAIRRSAATTPP